MKPWVMARRRWPQKGGRMNRMLVFLVTGLAAGAAATLSLSSDSPTISGSASVIDGDTIKRMHPPRLAITHKYLNGFADRDG